MVHINEKTLEINICAEIVYYYWRRLHKRILFLGPSLRREARLGYDIRASAKRMKPFYIQFKSGSRKSHSNNAIYIINNDSNNLQHHLLRSLSGTAAVFYGLPLMFSMQDIQQNQWQLLKSTEWIDVATMQPLPPPPNDEHEIHLNLTTRTYRIQSQEPSRYKESFSWWKAYSVIEESRILDTELILEENDRAIREVFQTDEIPEETVFGLVFGAIPQ